MHLARDQIHPRFSAVFTPFATALSPQNRWVKMAALVPWDEVATVFLRSMSVDEGRPSVDLRIVLGTLLVKHIRESK